MKKLLRFSAFATFVVLLSFWACQKEINPNTDPITGINHTAQGITSRDGQALASVSRGMLFFNSFDAMSQYTQGLKDREAVQENINAAYTSLGININAEEIPNLTDNPVCLASEIALGYTSARKVEENRVNAQLNAGQDVFSIITDPYWKTILNADNSVHIGSRIYKYYDNGGMAIVINNDWALYNNIKNKTFEELRQTHNLIITSEVNGDLGTFFSLKPDGKINEEKPILLPRLSTVAMPNGKRAIYNYSLVETPNGSPTYRWIYSDNTFTTGLSPRLLNENETATLVIDNGSGTNTSVVVSLAPCAKPEFTITIKNGTATFELPGLNTAYFTVMWLIDDKKMSSSNPFTISSPLSGSVTCQLLYKETVDGHIKGDIACDNTQKYTINTPPANCGIKGSILQTNIISNAGGSSQTWKIDCKLWVQSGEVGCSMKYLRKRLGVFIPASNQGVSTDISGTYIREVFVNGIKNCNIISASGTTALGNGTYPTSISFTIPEIQNIFKDPGKLTSAQKLLVNGVWVGPGTSGTPRLTLP